MHLRALLICALVTLAACTTAEDPLSRLVIHRGGQVGGPLAPALARHPQIVEAEGPWWVGVGSPPTSSDWTLVGRRANGSLWRRREVVVPASVAVLQTELPGAPLSHDVFRGWAVDGPVSPGGELAIRLFLTPPRAMPLRACAQLSIGDLTLPLGALLDGQVGLYPGVDRRPTLRHRALIPVPETTPLGANDAALELISCESGAVFSSAPVTLDVSPTGTPTLNDLTVRGATVDANAVFAEPTPGRDAIYRAADGSLKTRAGPPLPRVKRGDAWGLLVLGPTDVSTWGPHRKDSAKAPFARLRGLLDEADAAVVVLDAPAARGGDWMQTKDARRAHPNALKQLAWAGVHGIVLGPHVSDVGLHGLEQTVQNASAVGLRGAANTTLIPVGDGERSVVVEIINAPDPTSVADRVATATGQVVLVQVQGAADPIAAAKAIARSGAHGGWVLTDSSDPVIHVIDGTPVVVGLPALAGQQSYATRIYVRPEGVLRLDLLSLVNRVGWERDHAIARRQQLLVLQERSAEVGTWMPVGQTTAVVDVAGHWPIVASPDRPAPVLTAAQTGDTPAPEMPTRCEPGDEIASLVNLTFGDGLVLESATIQRTKDHGPITIDAVWRRTGPLPDEPVSIAWSVDPARPPWRATSSVCEGSWTFQQLNVGDRLRDRVTLWPPDGLESSKATVSLVVKAGDRALHTANGDRRHMLGPVP